MPGAAAPPSLFTIHALAEHIFGSLSVDAIQRVLEGRSTFVYRIVRGKEIFYLRVLPEIGSSFAAEVRVHELARKRGVLVPEIVHFDHLNPALGLSIMVTAEITGCSLATLPFDGTVEKVLFEAGRQIALLNEIPVSGFGWIRRDRSQVVVLEAHHQTIMQLVSEHLENDIMALEASDLITSEDAKKIRQLSGPNRNVLDIKQSTLAHGDFDVTHIFQHDGRYTGIIDLGEIRGTAWWYDLSYFQMHDGEVFPDGMLAWLAAGYSTIRPLSPDDLCRVRAGSVLIALRAWARALSREPERAMAHRARLSIARDLALLSG